MPKKAKELGPLAVSRLTQKGMWAVGGVAGLYLQVTETGARSWLLRVLIGGKRREMGLGGYPDVPLAQARETARVARDAISKGTDPIAERHGARKTLLAQAAAAITFADAAGRYIASNEAGWKNAKHGQQWRATLETYAYPVIGQLNVKAVELAHVMQILEPIWATKTETARRLRSRIELVLGWSIARGYRAGPNPAQWKGNLAPLLPKPSKVAKPEHHAAVPYAKVAAFATDLRAMPGTAARALELAMLTASRSGEVRGALWSEIDLDAALWTVPARRMKGNKEHRVPLSRQALALLKHAGSRDKKGLVFPSLTGVELSDMALLAVMRRMKAEAVPHGLRSTFRDWAAEQTNYPREVCEMALAHTVGSDAELAYRRSDLFAKRAKLMQEWANYVDKPEGGARVVPMRRKV